MTNIHPLSPSPPIPSQLHFLLFHLPLLSLLLLQPLLPTSSHIPAVYRTCADVLTVHGHPEDKERHAVELPAPADAESEPLHAAAELHGEELVLCVREVSAHLLVLLKQKQQSTLTSHPGAIRNLIHADRQ